MGFMFAPFLSPFTLGFLVARAKSAFPFPGFRSSNNGLYVSWRWTYGIASMYSLFVIFAIAFLGRET